MTVPQAQPLKARWCGARYAIATLFTAVMAGYADSHSLSLHAAQVPHGHGTAVYRSGWMYEGGWLNGKESGWGVLSDARDVTLYAHSTRLFFLVVPCQLVLMLPPLCVCARALSYEGEFAQGALNGTGTAFFPGGDVYEGEWRDNAFHGRGKYTSTVGCRYAAIVLCWLPQECTHHVTHPLLRPCSRSATKASGSVGGSTVGACSPPQTAPRRTTGSGRKGCRMVVATTSALCPCERAPRQLRQPLRQRKPLLRMP